MAIIIKFFQVFVEYLIEILPYFLLALLITTFLQTYINMLWIKRFLKNTFLAPVTTGIIGGLLPVCSCSMMPIALMINSLSSSYAPVLSFLIVAPIISPITIALTYALFGWEMTLFRLFGTFIFAMLMSYLAHTLFKKPTQIPTFMKQSKGKESKRDLFISSFLSTLKVMGKYILLGVFIASLIRAVVPSTWVSYVSGSIFSYPLISLVSIPVYVCSGEDVPIARAMFDVGFTGGNALTFMLASSGICLPTIIASMSFLPKRLSLLYALSWFLLSTVLGLLYDSLLYS